MIDLSIHNTSHIIKSILGIAEHIAGIHHDQGELMIVNYHGTPEKYLPDFKKQLEYFDRHYTFFDPATLKDYFNKTIAPQKKPFLLITFDDGIKNNLFAAKILNDKGIKALFFIVPDFINCPVEQQHYYFQKNIRPELNPKLFSQPEDSTALSWDDVSDLISQGHHIGSHTMSHTLIKEDSAVKSQEEIAGSKAYLEKKLSINIDSFCSINNTLESIGKTQVGMIATNYQYHFTTLPGSNINASPYFIRRSNIEPHWLKGAIINATGKWDRKRWKARSAQYQELLIHGA